jgi:alpha-tubulin suppressor-like RCC1 family protein
MEEVAVIQVEEQNHKNEDSTCGFGVKWGSSCSWPGIHLSPSNMKRSITNISAGTNHCAMICDTGEMFTWGEGKDGKLGLGKRALNTYVTTPTRVETAVNHHFVSAECGYCHTACLFLKNKTITAETLGCLTFGAGLCGALGTGSDAISSPVPAEILINTNLYHLLHDPSDDEFDDELLTFSNLTNNDTSATSSSSITISFRSIACGFAHMAAIVVVSSSTLSKSLLFTWGWNKRGQLGVGGTENEFLPRLVNGIRRYQTTSIGCGFEMTAAVTKAGDLFVFGQGLEGQLGLGDHLVFKEPQRHESLKKKCLTVACGADHTSVLLKDGNLLIWGRNAGDRPRQVKGLPNIKSERWSLSCSEHSVYVHDKEGGVYEWPNNEIVLSNGNGNEYNENNVEENTPLHMSTWKNGDSVVACTQFGAGDSWIVYIPSLPDFSKSKVTLKCNTINSSSSMRMCAGDVIPIELVVRDTEGRLVHHHYGYRNILSISLSYEGIEGGEKEEDSKMFGMNVACWDDEEEKEQSLSSSSSSVLKGMVSLTKSGHWTINVTYKGKHGEIQHVLGSPMNVLVIPDEVSPHHCVLINQNSSSQPIAGEKYYFNMISRDQYNNRIFNGGLSLLANVEQLKKNKLENELENKLENELENKSLSPETMIIDLGNGMYKVMVCIYTSGKYHVSIDQTLTATYLHKEGTATVTTVTAAVEKNNNGIENNGIYKRITMKERAARNFARKKEKQKIQKFLNKYSVRVTKEYNHDIPEQQCGDIMILNVMPACGCGSATHVIDKVEKTITIGMTSTCIIDVKDQYYNATVTDETKEFHINIKPLSSHLLKDIIVPMTIEKVSNITTNITKTADAIDDGTIDCAMDTTYTTTVTTNLVNCASNQYKLTYTPELRGAYYVEISLYGKPIVDSPFYIRVTENNASSLSISNKKVGSKNIYGKPKWESGSNNEMIKKRPQTAMARTRRRKEKKKQIKDDDQYVNPASPTARAPSPMLPPPSELMKSATSKKIIENKKIRKIKKRPNTANSVAKSNKSKIPSCTGIPSTCRNHNNKLEKKRGEKKIVKKKSSAKLSAHMLALCKARNINPIALKRKNNNKKSIIQKQKQRPGSSMGTRRKRTISSSSNIVKNDAIVVPSIIASSTQTNENESRSSQSTYQKHRPASSPPKRCGGRETNIHSRHGHILRALSNTSQRRTRPNSSIGIQNHYQKYQQHTNSIKIQQFGQNQMFGAGTGIRGRIPTRL